MGFEENLQNVGAKPGVPVTREQLIAAHQDAIQTASRAGSEGADFIRTHAGRIADLRAGRD